MDTQEAYEKIRGWFSREDAVFGAHEPNHEQFDVKCVYRGGGDPASKVRCAVGCLIPDEVYDPAWDGYGGIAHLLQSSDVAFELFAGVNADFLESVQCAHDTTALHDEPIAAFITSLDNRARDYGLSVVTP